MITYGITMFCLEFCVIGFPRQPKWGHLKDLHKALKLCEEALVATDPTTTSLGKNAEVCMYV